MKYIQMVFLFSFLFATTVVSSQTTDIFDDFEGNGNITTWFGDDCNIVVNTSNPFKLDGNTSDNVLEYHDVGGQYANVRFETDEVFDLTTYNVFSLNVYVPSGDVEGNQPNQISFKLQDGKLNEPWISQSEIIKPIVLDQWQTVTFDFKNDAFINLDPNSPPPINRNDFSRVVIQINGENNNDQVKAFLDDIEQLENEAEEYVYDYLVWSDEFDVDGPIDDTKWFHQTIIPNGESWFNGEIQHYTDRTENSVVEGGVLKITARKETFTDQGVTKSHTSARLNSKYAFTYGRVDIRAKLPSGIGTWPAIWMLGQNINEDGGYWDLQGFDETPWPACGEIDIMEHWGDNHGFVQSAMHTPSSFGGTVNKGGRFIPDVSSEFHEYSMDWSPERIVFSVDGIVHYTYNPSIKDQNTWPFDDPQYFLLNIAIQPFIQSSFTQSSMEIDYVRVYQESPLFVSSDFVKKDIEMYPNPVNDRFTIELNNAITQKIDLQIHSFGGQLIIGRNTMIINGRINVDHLSSLPPGLYLLSFKLNDEIFSINFNKI